LAGDLTIRQGLRIPEGQDVTLDLNGNTLYLAAGSRILVEPGASLTMYGGTVCPLEEDDQEAPEYLIQCVAGTVNLSDVTMTTDRSILLVSDHETQGLDSRIVLTNCELEAGDSAVLLHGNGVDTARKTSLTATNSIIKSSNEYGILGYNNTDGTGDWGTSIELYGCTIEGAKAGILHPQRKSTLYVEESSITGGKGIEILGGTVDIVDSEITGTESNGVQVETSEDWEIAVTLSGDQTKVTGKDRAIYIDRKDLPNAYVVVKGGTYSSDVKDYREEGSDE
jgi:hypothetical protein